MFFKPPKKLILETTSFKLFQKGDISIFRYPKGAASTICKILKKIKHPNILSITEFKEKSGYLDINSTAYYDLYTSFLVPFELTNSDFDLYILFTLRATLDFLHRQCKVLHQNLVVSALFLNSNGTLVLGGFERAIILDSDENSYYESDINMFGNLCSVFGYEFEDIKKIYENNVLGIGDNSGKITCNNEEFCNSEDSSAELTTYDTKTKLSKLNINDKNGIIDKYLFIEECIAIFEILETEKRVKLMGVANKKLPLVIRSSLSSLFLKIDLLDLSGAVSKHKRDMNADTEYNNSGEKYKFKVKSYNDKNITDNGFAYTIDFFIKMDLPNYDLHMEKLILVLDSSFRYTLLQKIDFFVNKVNWNNRTIIKNLLLGLACKNLSRITLIAVEKIFSVLNKQSTCLFVRACRNINIVDFSAEQNEHNYNDDVNKDKDGMLNRNDAQILADIVRNNHLYAAFPEEIYKLILKNLDSIEIVSILDLLLGEIGIRKICTELLPAMCIHILKNKDLIKEIYKILEYLEFNKNEIANVDNGSWMGVLKRYANQSIDNIKSKTGINSESRGFRGLFKWKSNIPNGKMTEKDEIVDEKNHNKKSLVSTELKKNNQGKNKDLGNQKKEDVDISKDFEKNQKSDDGWSNW